MIGRRPRPDDVVVLAYHRVGRRTSSPIDLTESDFAGHLDRVADRVIDLDSAVAVLARPAPPPTDAVDAAGPPHVVLTFDDGTADWPDVVLPHLVARRLPATFFVSTGAVDSGGALGDGATPVSWSGLADIVASGLATIGSHTDEHTVLAHADAATATAAIDRSVDRIEDRLGVACAHFAYPDARPGSSAADAIVRARFASAALAGDRFNRAGRTDVHRLGRHMLLDGNDGLDRALAGRGAVGGWWREHRWAWRQAARARMRR